VDQSKLENYFTKLHLANFLLHQAASRELSASPSCISRTFCFTKLHLANFLLHQAASRELYGGTHLASPQHGLLLRYGRSHDLHTHSNTHTDIFVIHPFLFLLNDSYAHKNSHCSDDCQLSEEVCIDGEHDDYRWQLVNKVNPKIDRNLFPLVPKLEEALNSVLVSDIVCNSSNFLSNDRKCGATEYSHIIVNTLCRTAIELVLYYCNNDRDLLIIESGAVTKAPCDHEDGIEEGLYVSNSFYNRILDSVWILIDSRPAMRSTLTFTAVQFMKHLLGQLSKLSMNSTTGDLCHSLDQLTNTIESQINQISRTTANIASQAILEHILLTEKQSFTILIHSFSSILTATLAELFHLCIEDSVSLIIIGTESRPLNEGISSLNKLDSILQGMIQHKPNRINY